MIKVAVILSGNGVFDGAEITEAVLTLLHIEKAGASYRCFAPDIEQHHTINHLTGEPMSPNRNVLVEAARIARGEIEAVTALNADAFDALIVPGGFGAAKNLTDFAINGANATIDPQVAAICKAFAVAKKPAGYMCIAPVIIPMVYDQGAKMTIGNDIDTAAAITALGGEHVNCLPDEIVVDCVNRIVSTPAYMTAQSIVEVDNGIGKLVQQVLTMVRGRGC